MQKKKCYLLKVRYFAWGKLQLIQNLNIFGSQSSLFIVGTLKIIKQNISCTRSFVLRIIDPEMISKQLLS